MKRGLRQRQQQFYPINQRHGGLSPGYPRPLPERRAQQSRASGKGMRGSGLRPRGAGPAKDGSALPRGAPRSLRSGARAAAPGPPVSAPHLTGRASSPKLDGCFAAKVERARVRSPRERVGAGSAGPGGEGDRAAGPPPGTHTPRRPPPPPGTSEAPSAAALTHRRQASSAMPSRSFVLRCLTADTRRSSTWLTTRGARRPGPSHAAQPDPDAGGPASARWVSSRRTTAHARVRPPPSPASCHSAWNLRGLSHCFQECSWGGGRAAHAPARRACFAELQLDSGGRDGDARSLNPTCRRHLSQAPEGCDR